MKNRPIIVVSNPMDLHADRGVERFRELGSEVIRLNSNIISTAGGFSQSLEGGAIRGMISDGTATVDLEDVKSVWWRRPGKPELAEGFSEEEEAFAQRELLHAQRGCWAALDCYWVNRPDDNKVASWKNEQLVRAANLGFDTPRSLITSDPDKLQEFYDRFSGKIIYKTLVGCGLGQEHATMLTKTTLVTPELFAQHREAVRTVPCLFQEYIEKTVEYRVTIIGDDLFAAEIHSQERPETRIDWRNYSVPTKYVAGKLPPGVAERCMAFVRSYNLEYSAIDLILTPDGRIVFLENNASGQFMWIEQLIPQFRITDALHSCLSNGVKRPRTNGMLIKGVIQPAA